MLLGIVSGDTVYQLSLLCDCGPVSAEVSSIRCYPRDNKGRALRLPAKKQTEFRTTLNGPKRTHDNFLFSLKQGDYSRGDWAKPATNGKQQGLQQIPALVGMCPITKGHFTK